MILNSWQLIKGPTPSTSACTYHASDAHSAFQSTPIDTINEGGQHGSRSVRAPRQPDVSMFQLHPNRTPLGSEESALTSQRQGAQAPWGLITRDEGIIRGCQGGRLMPLTAVSREAQLSPPQAELQPPHSCGAGQERCWGTEGGQQTCQLIMNLRSVQPSVPGYVNVCACLHTAPP